MNINAQIIDQRVRALAEQFKEEFASLFNIKKDENKLRSAAFTLLCVKTVLDISFEESLDSQTEGGNDFGIDAIHISDIRDGEFTVTLFQGKYHADLEGNKNYKEESVTKSIQAVRYIFDPDAQFTANDRLKPRIEEIRSLIQEGNIPLVRFILCNNGLKWNDASQKLIDNESSFKDRVRFEHINHDSLIGLLQSSQPIKDSLPFKGKAIVEDFDYIRVIIGKVAVSDIEALIDRYGDRLLERNIRRYLGLSGNRVNLGIQQTLQEPDQRSRFYFYNNGLTLICNKFDYNSLQGENYQVKVEGLQIINGGQTCLTIQKTLKNLNGGQSNLDKAFVLVRLYQLPGDGSSNLIHSITYATNSQNPVDLRDLRSNDEIQKNLELSIKSLGYEYRRQRSDATMKSTDITTATAAEAVLSVWRREPHLAKFKSREHFDRYYHDIFSSDLNGAQVIIATLLFRFAENKRRNPPADSPKFLPYASCFIAMLMGEQLLKEMSLSNCNLLNHINFKTATSLLEKNSEAYFEAALISIKKALHSLYGDEHLRSISLQQLSATFRRSDLLRPSLFNIVEIRQ